MEQQAIFDNSLTGIAFLRERKIVRCNASFERMFGYESGELIGQSASILYPSYDAFEQREQRFSPVLLSGGSFEEDVQQARKDGQPIWCCAQLKLVDAQTPEQGTVLTVQDITQRRQAEQALVRLAHLDGLTGIANRRALDEALEAACRQMCRDNSGLTLALLDVDCFKQFNDNYGHSAGDQALCLVANAVAAAARRPYDLAARYGGEEFALLLPGCVESAIVLERLRLAVMEEAIPHAYSTAAGVISVSIGAVSVTGDEACQPEVLLAQADALLYKAKREGRNRVALHSPSMQRAPDEVHARRRGTE